jgi:hypothetical protein
MLYDAEILSSNQRAPWPNGKALLSGGKDCGFESHWCRFCPFNDLFAIVNCRSADGGGAVVVDVLRRSRKEQPNGRLRRWVLEHRL